MLFDQISEDIKQAMLAKDKVALDALRGIKKEFLEAKTAKGADGELPDERALQILQKMVKQRKEAAEMFRAANRPELAEDEMAQCAVIERYLPAMMSEEELKAQRYVFIAGGVGTAPVYPQVKWLHERGVAVDVIIGAKTEDLMIYVKEMEAVCDNLYLCTDDGSVGFKGLVTARLEKLILEEGKKYTQAVAIGPMIMMKFATLTAKKLELPIIVSLNTLMVDGTGMCGACRVTVAGKTRFACVEGPEFNGYDVDFDEAMRRQTMYKREETDANEHHKCRIGRGR